MYDIGGEPDCSEHATLFMKHIFVYVYTTVRIATIANVNHYNIAYAGSNGVFLGMSHVPSALSRLRRC